jgi:pimeloyl-ACP methyl ester carboxylesterase
LDDHSYWTKVQGLDIHYKRLGKGQPVIFIHGAANDWHEWKKNLAFLAQNFQVYALDLPGYGQSQPADVPVSPAWAASFLSDFMKVLDLSSAHIVGHSMGGMVAMVFALDHAEMVNKLVLVNSGGLGDLSRRGWLILQLTKIPKKLLGKEKNKYLKSTKDDWIFIKRLPDIKPKTMVIWGDKDIYLPVSQAKLAHSLIPDCKLHIFPQCGHAPQRESVDEFNNLIYQFLSE